MFVLTYAMT